jgi:predicted site-specific integrase-resolvase
MQDVRHFNQEQLARRWSVSPRTLERWRSIGRGPAFLRLVGRVAYRLEDIEAFEKAGLHFTDAAAGGRR